MQCHQKILVSVIGALCVSSAVYAVGDEKGYPDPAVKAPEAMRSNYVEPKMSHASYGSLKIVVPMTTDDKAIQGMKLRNLENSLDSVAKWGGKMQSTVVVYSKGVSLLKDPAPDTQKKIDALKARGVRFEVCDNTLREQGIDFHQLYHVADADIVPSGFAEVAYLQSKKNYVVDPVN